MKQVTITVQRFCRKYAIGKTKTYELIRSADLQTLKVGRKRLILVESADRLIEKLSSEGQL